MNIRNRRIAKLERLAALDEASRATRATLEKALGGVSVDKELAKDSDKLPDFQHNFRRLKPELYPQYEHHVKLADYYKQLENARQSFAARFSYRVKVSNSFRILERSLTVDLPAGHDQTLVTLSSVAYDGHVIIDDEKYDFTPDQAVFMVREHGGADFGDGDGSAIRLFAPTTGYVAQFIPPKDKKSGPGHYEQADIRTAPAHLQRMNEIASLVVARSIPQL